VQALDQLGQGRLARSRGPDHAEDLARGDIQTDRRQHFLPFGPVAEHMFQRDAAIDIRKAGP
jgi:hypothetical protein